MGRAERRAFSLLNTRFQRGKQRKFRNLGCDAAAVFINASSRLHDAEGFGFGCDIGLSSGRLHAKGPIGLEELTCEKYVVFGNGQLRFPHPVPETYFDAIMLKRP